MVDAIKPFTAWLHLHPYYGVAFAFLIAFLESLAIVGSIIPGSVTLTALGILVGAGVIPAIPTLVAAIIGAILGDLLSFYLGHHFHEDIKTRWPFKNYPGLLAKGEAFFNRHGGKSIFVGRFVGPIRSILPLVAGMLNMKTSRFIIADVISGIFWAPAYLMPGMLLGAASLELAPEQATRLLFFVLLILVAIWLVGWLLRKIGSWLLIKVDSVLARAWHYLKSKPRCRLLVTLLQDPRQSNGHGQLGLAILCLLSLIAFLLVALNIMHSGALTALNAPLFHFFQSIRLPQVDLVMVAVTFLYDKYVILCMVILTCAWLGFGGYWRASTHLLATAVIACAVVILFKPFVHSMRPTGLMLVRHGFSFPSGHTTLSVAVIGFICLLLSSELNPVWRRLITWNFVVQCMLVMTSRLYLGAHWLTDVVGGLLAGSWVFSLTYLSYNRQLKPRLPVTQLLLVISLSWLSAWIGFNYVTFNKALYNSQINNPIKQISPKKWWQQTSPILPLYRKNRFDQPREIFNLQWQDKMSNIRARLTAAGWREVNTYDIHTTLRSLAAKDKSQVLPLLNQQYQFQSPTATFIKRYAANSPILVLRLWPSLYQLTDSKAPLWLGSLHYRIIWQQRWLKQRQAQINKLEPITYWLAPILSQYDYRTIEYPITTPIPHALNKLKAQLILIRQK